MMTLASWVRANCLVGLLAGVAEANYLSHQAIPAMPGAAPLLLVAAVSLVGLVGFLLVETKAKLAAALIGPVVLAGTCFAAGLAAYVTIMTWAMWHGMRG
jgi:hypothetical protein